MFMYTRISNGFKVFRDAKLGVVPTLRSKAKLRVWVSCNVVHDVSGSL